MCVMLVMNVVVVSSKITNIYLNFGSNIVHYLDLHVVPDLAAPTVLGIDWFTVYNPMIVWQIPLILLGCTNNITTNKHGRCIIYTGFIYHASLASIMTTSEA